MASLVGQQETVVCCTVHAKKWEYIKLLGLWFSRKAARLVELPMAKPSYFV